MEDLSKEIEQTTRNQRVEYEEFVASQQTLQVEYEKIQYSLTYEREAYSKLELTYCKCSCFFVLEEKKQHVVLDFQRD